MNRRIINWLLFSGAVVLMLMIAFFNHRLSQVHPDEVKAATHHSQHHQQQQQQQQQPKSGAQIRRGEEDWPETDPPEIERAPRQLLIFDTALGRLSNQLLTMTAAMALAAKLNRTAVLPPLFLGGGRGGGGSHVVPLTDMFNFESWRTRHDPTLYCDPNPTHRARELGVSPICFMLEHELDWIEHFALVTTVGGKGADEDKKKSAQKRKHSTGPLFTLLNDRLGCMRMKGVKPHPVRRAQRPVFQCEEGPRTQSVESKKRLQDVLRAGRSLRSAPILFVPLAMYVSDSLEHLVIRAWNAFTPSIAVRDVFTRCRDKVTTPVSGSGSGSGVGAGFAALTVAVHLRALEGSCSDRVQQVIREAPLLSDGGRAPANAGQILAHHCKIDAPYVVDLLSRDETVRKACAGQPLKSCAVAIVVADDGQAPELRANFVSGLKSALPSGIVSSLSICHGSISIAPEHALAAAATAENADNNNNNNNTKIWLASSAPVAQGTLALLTDFWMLDQSDVFIGNQLSTVSVNICRHRLSQEKLCQNFVTPNSGAVGTKS